jgi:hypothetical protein
VKKAEHRDSVAGMKEDQPIDISLFTAPRESPFYWKPFAAPDELRKNAGPGFDYNFSYYSVKKMSGASFAFHHARRYVVHDTWTTVVR